MLEDDYNKHSGKVSDKWSHYLRAYDEFLNGLKDRPIRLLEIGIQNGGSLEVWAHYFQNAEVLVGCDIDPACARLVYADARIKVVIGDANAAETEQRIKAASAQYDVIIDDGSHRSSDIIDSFIRYLPLLADGGIYIGEDLHCSYWESYEGGIFNPKSSINFFKKLVDVVNYEHWGLAQKRTALLQFADASMVDRLEESLARIHAIEFRNSLCIIRTNDKSWSLLGKRRIVGTKALVNTEVLDLDGTSIYEGRPLDESANRWNDFQLQPEEMIRTIQTMKEEALASELQLHEATARAQALEVHSQALESHAQTLEGRAQALEANVASMAGQILEQRSAAEAVERDLEAKIARLQVMTREFEAKNSGLKERLRADTQALDTATRKASELQEQLEQQGREHAIEIANLVTRAQEAQAQIISSFHRSASWRATAPLRAFSRAIRPPAPAAAASAGTPAAGDRAETAPRTASIAHPDVDAKAAMRASLRVRFDAFLTGSGKLRFAPCDAPDVSIIVILYNSVELTYACLASITEALHGSAIQAELVIVDNGSTDETPELLNRIEGATIIRSDENLHFLRGANKAALASRGRHLLFLNNDATLLPGSLEAAVETCESQDNIGAVGGRIILPDGRLQEAGSIVWRDGACSGYGRGDAPDAPEYMYRHDVDYCSGAFLLTPRALFQSLGAFDERYAPAYYEETDYCLRLWQSGHRVVFDPRVVILHYEFGSATASAQALALQQKNHGIFRDRHEAWLARKDTASPSAMFAASRAQSSGKRVLFIEDRVPHPSLGSGYPRSNEMLRAIEQSGANVTLFPMFHHEETWAEIRESVPESIEVMRGYAAKDLHRFLSQRRGHYDAAVVCRPHNMRAFLDVTSAEPGLLGDTAVIYDAEALFSVRTLVERKLNGEDVSPNEAQRMIAEEISLTRSATAIISVSEAEKAQFEMHGRDSVFVLGHSVAARPTPAAFEQRRDFLFVGGIHSDDSPNADSLRWFISNVWPLVVDRLGARPQLQIVGLNRAPSVLKLGSPNVHMVGRVDDETLASYYDHARVVIAPTRIAAGIPMKAHGAAAYGVPLVTTSLIAGQLGWTSGTHLLAADEAQAFAEACIRLYTDGSLWKSVRDAALDKVESDCSSARFTQTMQALLERVPQRHRQPSATAEPAL